MRLFFTQLFTFASKQIAFIAEQNLKFCSRLLRHKCLQNGGWYEMANIIDYIIWRGDLSFETAPFNEVDNLILSELSYLNFEGIVAGDGDKEIPLYKAAEIYFNEEIFTYRRSDANRFKFNFCRRLFN